jgi:hypothetical protein
MLMRPSLLSDDALPLWQSAEFARALRRMGTDAQIDRLADAGQALVVRRSFGPFGTVAFTSRGPIWAAGAQEAEQIAGLRASGLHVINADGTAPNVLRRAGFRRIRRAAEVSVLDVQPDMDAQLRQCRSKWRNAYRQGLRAGLITGHRPFHPQKDGWIFSADRAQQKDKGYRALPPTFVQAMAAIDRKAVMVSQMMMGPTPIAAMLFLVHGAAATYQIGVTTAAGRAARAHHVLLMQACAKLANRGVQQIELGLHHPQDAPGLARFKLGSGARLQELGGTWMKVPLL